uniref:60S ribosomal protein L27a n=1 Tax=Serinus canaria TaxID=9135 RepID=A0A8C9KNK4_SERCA
MPSRLRDTRKLRGHTSHSHLSTHRKHPRGHGNSGGNQHHRMNFDKHHSGYFRKVGYYKALGKGKRHKQLPIAKAKFSEEAQRGKTKLVAPVFVAVPPLKVFKARLDEALSNVV